MIDYDHSINLHSLEGPRKAVEYLFAETKPTSLLDVGCGEGMWLNAFFDAGVKDVLGIDGVSISPSRFRIPIEKFRQVDLTKPCDLGRTFDWAICLEVGEHLEECNAKALISNIVAHADNVLFSAACPNQPGQHHVNCQWPDYWQSIFNAHGFACDDTFRWKIWSMNEVEVWYRQNLFTARRDSRAGQEPRIASVVHPEMIRWLAEPFYAATVAKRIEQGGMPLTWYASVWPRAIYSKLSRFLFR